MKKINPFLWFDSEAEQAAQFYVGIFKNSKIGKVARYPKEAAEKIGRPPESVMTVEFTLDRVEFVALNGGPQFKFTEAISFAVNCETQDEIDYFWEKLSADGDPPGRAVGSKTNSVFRGRSARSFSAICWPIPIKRKQSAS
jgi:predicted 3-demethylubiquinone-9 3-methyltransferase (glyoxalase superfamily)